MARAREVLGPDAAMGRSASNVEEARGRAEGADYLGIGRVFTTPTKPDVDAGELRRVERVTRGLP